MRLRRALLAAAVLASGCAAPAPAEPPPPAPAEPRVVGYLAGWGVYARDFQVADVAAGRLTHLVYAFGSVDGGRCAPADPWADTARPYPAAESVGGRPATGGAIGQLRLLKAAHPDLKVLWSFGGWNGSAGFADAARDPAGFAASCARLLDDPRWAGVFDGIDVDWEYPNACGRQCDTSGPGALAAVVAALRGALGPDRLVTAAVPADAGKLAAADYAGAARHLDWVAAMTYDFAGTGGGGDVTAAHSALTAYPGAPRPDAVGDAAIGRLTALGIPAGKLLLGIGFYGRGWVGVRDAAPGSAAAGPAPGRFEAGMEDYAVLARRCPPTGEAGGTAYAFCNGQWWSYDTPATVTAKARWARERGLGGAFAWELSGDSPDAALLTAMAAGLGRP
ncbi:glycoside hydrolase family 18 protein [Spirilliplanes yamanashiensis]|uniref:chitinase n=1 Tax=Spirilliplanes yamanashiensis TaxID=42233 RepID=A0A8J4DJM1_9ACTN|nr:glycoside hydrolase family 18 protein [Spirilliplanes yamanashiensis]MDP9817537.1 chitinase [Spirilliplanes yamanashiensis]GIJ04347.1 chitinase [Spirilliplanes yamanashiensis]